MAPADWASRGWPSDMVPAMAGLSLRFESPRMNFGKLTPKYAVQTVPPASQLARPAIVLRNVGVTFATDTGPVEALAKLNLTINEHEFVSVVGPSGCGKSTVLRILASLLAPSYGEDHILVTSAETAGTASR